MAAGLFAIGNDVGRNDIYEEIDAVGAWTSADGRSWEKVGTLESLVPKAAILESDGTNLVALRDGEDDVGLDRRPGLAAGVDERGPSGAGQLPVPAVRVQPASSTSGYDTRMWVTDTS